MMENEGKAPLKKIIAVDDVALQLDSIKSRLQHRYEVFTAQSAA